MSREPNFRGAATLPPDQADIRRQQEIKKSLDGAVPEWLKGGRLVTASLTDANESSVTHGLKRQPKGWFMGSVGGDADVCNVFQTSADSNVIKMVNRGATGGITFTIWVW